MTDATNSTDDEVRAEQDNTADASPIGDTDEGATGEAGEGIEALRAQLEETQALYARARADYANLERRSQEQRFEVGRTALADAVRGFLPVLDDLQRAVEAAEGGTRGADEAGWLEGVRLVAQKFQTVLEQHGVTEIDALGQPFDPTRHEAVGHAPGPDGQVVHLLQRGYTLRDRVIRPAMVMVGDGAPAEE